MTELKKVCAKCREVKPLTEEFFPHNRHSKDGYDGRCKACWRLRSKERSRRKSGGRTREERAQETVESMHRAASGPGWRQSAVKTVELSAARGAGKVTAARGAGKVTAARAELKVERVPGVEVRLLGRLADMREDGLELVEYQGGTLAEAVALHRARTGYQGRLYAYVYGSEFALPQRYFLEKPLAVRAPAEAGKSPDKKGRKNVR